VLVDSLAAGTPVVATAFPHAVELLDDGAGIVVRHESPDDIAAALRLVLTQPAVHAGLRAAATRTGAALSWPLVARSYAELVQRQLGATEAA
jgi:glycosyltransferase involved in cell wall biosynthesis